MSIFRENKTREIQLFGQVLRHAPSGNPFGQPKPVNLNNGLDIQGIAYFNGGFAVVQEPGVQIHNPMEIQQYMQSIPEPATMALLGLGSLALFGSGYKRRDPGLFVPKDMKE